MQPTREASTSGHSQTGGVVGSFHIHIAVGQEDKQLKTKDTEVCRVPSGVCSLLRSGAEYHLLHMGRSVVRKKRKTTRRRRERKEESVIQEKKTPETVIRGELFPLTSRFARGTFRWKDKIPSCTRERRRREADRRAKDRKGRGIVGMQSRHETHGVYGEI